MKFCGRCESLCEVFQIGFTSAKNMDSHRPDPHKIHMSGPEAERQARVFCCANKMRTKVIPTARFEI